MNALDHWAIRIYKGCGVFGTLGTLKGRVQ